MVAKQSDASNPVTLPAEGSDPFMKSAEIEESVKSPETKHEGIPDEGKENPQQMQIWITG